jgi:hypothetical protein
VRRRGRGYEAVRVKTGRKGTEEGEGTAFARSQCTSLKGENEDTLGTKERRSEGEKKERGGGGRRRLKRN